MARAPRPVLPDKLQLRYRLSDLPTSTHRAGLAGLVLFLAWRETCEARPTRPSRGVCRIATLTDDGAALEIDREGLQDLFDEVFEAKVDEEAAARLAVQAAEKKLRKEKATAKGKGKAVKEDDDKERKPPLFVAGGPIAYWDPVGAVGPWASLWRESAYSVIRAIPKTRVPYEQRAAGKPVDLVSAFWKSLQENAALPMKGHFLLGAAESTPDGIAWTDTAERILLLYFWLFAAQVYALMQLEPGEKEFLRVAGYVVAVPDVARLRTYTTRYPRALLARSQTSVARYPADARVASLAEAGLTYTSLFGNEEAEDLLLGVDLFRLAKGKNSHLFRVLEISRVVPSRDVLTAYAQARGRFFSPAHRAFRFDNLVSGRPPFTGYADLLQRRPLAETLESRWFIHDANEEEKLAKPRTPSDVAPEAQEGEIESSTPAERPPLTLEALVRDLLSQHLVSKLFDKYRLRWQDVKGTPALERSYLEKKRKEARDIGLRLRNERGSSFRWAFVRIVTSWQQYLPPDRYALLLTALEQSPDRVRDATMLSLAALQWIRGENAPKSE